MHSLVDVPSYIKQVFDAIIIAWSFFFDMRPLIISEKELETSANEVSSYRCALRRLFVMRVILRQSYIERARRVL